MHNWRMFFTLTSLIIVTTIIIPHVFGFQNFTQWGGMYTDGWCTAYTASASVPDIATPTPGVLIKTMQAPTTRVVWYSPMHNETSCIAWARSHCGRLWKDGWTIAAVYPYLRQKFLADKKDVCSTIPPVQWFIQPEQPI